MKSLPDRIMGSAEAVPEATPIQAEDLLHFGDRAAVSRARSRLASSDRLRRICRGLYMRPIQTRFGLRAPRREMVLAALSGLWDETIVANGGDAANWLGLTTQVPVRAVYLTSGPDRVLHFGAQRVEFRHAPSWQLVRGACEHSHVDSGATRQAVGTQPGRARAARTVRHQRSV